MKLTDAHFQTFKDQGFVVVEGFYPEEKRAAIAASALAFTVGCEAM